MVIVPPAPGVTSALGLLMAEANESGLAVAVLTQCSAPPHLQVLGLEHGLGPLEPMQVAVYRSQASRGSKAVDSLQRMLVQTLRQAGA